jgi:hypothetical protein
MSASETRSQFATHQSKPPRRCFTYCTGEQRARQRHRRPPAPPPPPADGLCDGLCSLLLRDPPCCLRLGVSGLPRLGPSRGGRENTGSRRCRLRSKLATSTAVLVNGLTKRPAAAAYCCFHKNLHGQVNRHKPLQRGRVLEQFGCPMHAHDNHHHHHHTHTKTHRGMHRNDKSRAIQLVAFGMKTRPLRKHGPCATQVPTQ